MKLYENIRMYRKQKRLTQDELARLAGYTDRSSIAKIEKGSVDLSQSKIQQFADIFGITPGDLMGWDEKEKPAESDELSEKRQALIDFALSVPEDKAALVLKVLKSLVEEDE